MKTTIADERTFNDWEKLPWATMRAQVSQLQERIAKAAINKDRQTLHSLQRLGLRSFAFKCLAVHQVAEVNDGKNTAGVDGVKSLSPAGCLRLAKSLDLAPTGTPLKRVWISKPGKDEKRPLSIPSMRDRAQQAWVKLVLEPEWEPMFEPNSYGFRPGRCAADAVEAVFSGICHHRRGKFVLDADIRACFDRINHAALLGKLRSIAPIHSLIRGWLKVGILDGAQHIKIREGIPQGGVISPLLANVALHGLENHIRSCIPPRVKSGTKYIPNQPITVRYADDLVILHHDKEAIIQCQQAAGTFLATLGLEFNQAKTRIGHTLDVVDGQKPGFDFLGFNFRSYPLSPRHKKKNGKTDFVTLVKPSRDALIKHQRHLADIIRQHRSDSQVNLIKRLNPIILGWANYYRSACSNDAFSKLDHLIYLKLRRWCTRRRCNSPGGWVAKYWNHGQPWLFRDADTGECLQKHSDVKILRHIKVRGNSNPYDGDRPYWARRRKCRKRPLSNESESTSPPPKEVEHLESDETQADLWR